MLPSRLNNKTKTEIVDTETNEVIEVDDNEQKKKDDSPKNRDSILSTFSEKKSEAPKKFQISYSIFFNNYESICILLTCTISMVTLYHYETILAVRLTQDMHLAEENLGLFFSA